MKPEIENLKALIHGRELTAYQKALAMNEWSKLQLYVGDLEKGIQRELLIDFCNDGSIQKIVPTIANSIEELVDEYLKSKQ